MKPTEKSVSKGKKKVRNSKPGKITKSRKEARKEQRKQKKLAKAAYFQRKKEPIEGQVVAKRVSEEKGNKESKNVTEKKTKKLVTEEKRQREFERKKRQRRRQQLKEENLKEDRIIKRLEKQLKLNKKKSKTVPKSFVADGLDYLLDFCMDEDRSRILQTERQLLEDELDTEFKKDFTMVTGEEMSEDAEEGDTELEGEKNGEEKDENSVDNNSTDDLTDSSETDDDDDDDVSNELPKQKLKREGRNREKGKVSDSTSSSDVDEIMEMKTDEEEDAENNDDETWEDIYGRKRDRKGSVIQDGSKYIPPGARRTSSNVDEEKLLALRRRLKGALNRLAEHNIHSITNQVEELYMTNSRNDMNEMLSKLMIEALVAPVLTPDRLVSEHIMLIAILHANVGVEVGAHFLLKLVKMCDEMLKQSCDIENKQLDNLILMISHLYNFKIYGHGLLYQIMEKLSTKFTEKEIELILLILRTVGFPLRKDDPIALKDFIQKLQQRASQEKGDNARVKFMLDVLLAIKNNNVNKIPQYDPSHVAHLKKLMKSVLRKGNTVTQFNVSLEDLLNADERGKWWVVGSAWCGTIGTAEQTKKKKDGNLIFGQKIMELARKQRMNTDTRKNIFCVLMTAEDYLDAFEKLHHLGLKDQQEREVIHVLIHCCLQESKFNPYYAVLAQKLCEYNRKYQLTIQYALWDKIKTLQDYNSQQLSNLARFLTYLFMERSLPFSVLKVVHFAELDKYTMRLLRQTILGILLHENEEACYQVFERVSMSPQLHSFRESLRLFISHFLLKNINSSDALNEKEALLKKRAEAVDKILISRGSMQIF